jgi:dimethylaniline monooxygenase (N-oxide forming)
LGRTGRCENVWTLSTFPDVHLLTIRYRYLQINPNVKLTIFESERKLGGVWNEDRCFPGFLADSPTGLFDYSDIPMRDVIGQKDWTDLSGYKVYEYLRIYAERFALLERLRLETKVSKVSRNVDGQAWDIEIEGSEEVVTCDKLIVASGLNSKPIWPEISREGFDGLAIHSKDIGLHHQELTSEKINRVTVYAGCKSAVDAITLCIMAGKKVDWVIRETGNGPSVMGSMKTRGVHGARFAGRFKDILTPSIFSTNTFWYRFLHSGNSRLGSWIFRKVWEKVSSVPFTMEPYKTKCPNMEKLMPESQKWVILSFLDVA